jgi:glycosyltransferase involved in cell wall biosynthesis
MLDLADRITCYSRFGASLIETSTPIDVVLGGVDDDFFSSGDAPAKRDRLVYVGRLMPHKGIDRLLAALPPDVPLSICGRPYHSEYHELLRALAAGKRVEFLTNSTDDEVRELYRRAIAVVLPSVYVDCYGTPQAAPELMGFSLLEGMACGAPAICSRVGGMPEFVDHGETGFIFDELAELTDYIQRLAQDSALAGTMGEQGRREVGERYGLARSGATMSSIYDEISDRRVPA